MFKSDKSWVATLLIVIAFVLFGWVLYRYAINVPWFDDVEVFPGAVVIWMKSSLADGIKELFRPNNEHRMLPGKLAGVLCYQLTGQLNMRWLAMAANLNLMGVMWLFWQFFKKQQLGIVYFLPICWCMLQPQFYLTSHWSITAWQHQSVLFWGFFTIFLLAKNTQKSFLWAILTGFVTTFCMSNGLLFWVVGGVLLFVQLRYKYLMVWVGAMGLAIFAYFYGFNNTANNNGLAYFWQHPHESFFGFFTFFGGAIDFWQDLPILKRAILPTILGFLLVCFCGWWLWGIAKQVWGRFRKPQTSPHISPEMVFLLGCLLFLAFNGGLIALLRPRFGYFVMLVGNYKIYPALLLSLSYLALLTQTPTRKQLWIALGLSLIFNVAAYLKFTPEVAQRRQQMLVNGYNQQHNGIGLAAELNSTFAQYTEDQMQYLTQHQAYFYPEVFEEKILKSTVAKDSITIAVQENGEEFLIENTDFEKKSGLNDGVFVVLQSADRAYLVATKTPKYGGKNPFKSMPGFVASLPPKSYQPAIYQVKVLKIEDGKQQLLETGETVVITR